MEGGRNVGMIIGRPALKTFYIMEILMRRTDEEHALNASQIGKILESEYGVKVNRQTIYTEIEKLEEADMDIAIGGLQQHSHTPCLLAARSGAEEDQGQHD